MQKINVCGIVIWHLNTLRNADGRLLWSDVFTFYALPIILGALFYWLEWVVSKDALGLSITVFSIFAALLLSVQVALYNVSLRPLSEPKDPKKRKSFEDIKKNRDSLMKELNDNISYLIVLSVVFITVLLACYVMGWERGFASAAVFAIYVHFFLTLLMVVKRASIVFSREYESSHAQD
jgi:sterol desaturase/sphingolipid hydroxylase (fatty acid hydroxylase superfamily)